MKFHVILAFSLLALLFKPATSVAQRIEESDTRAMMQANFLYQFAANCNWAPEVRKGKFIIGVIGNPAVYEHIMAKYGNKPIGTQTIEVVQSNEIPTSGVYHIVLVDKSRKAELSKVTKESRKNILIVTNWDGALNFGSHINFKTIDGNIRYEMNPSAMEEKKITPGVKILQWKVD
jgi:hypothetical protein